MAKSAGGADLLGKKPSLKQLINVVVPRVSSKWKAIGLGLDIEDCRLAAIEKSEHYQTDACCTEMFSNWLNLAPRTGGLPLTWSSVLSAIEKVESATSEELLAELKSSVEPPLPRHYTTPHHPTTLYTTPHHYTMLHLSTHHTTTHHSSLDSILASIKLFCSALHYLEYLHKVCREPHWMQLSSY